MTRAVAATCALLFALCGCTTTAPPPDTADVSHHPSVEIGGARTDGTGFVPWHGTDPHPALIAGIQGGQHLWVSMRMQDLWPKQILLAVTMHLVDTGELVQPGKIERIISSLVNWSDAYGYDGFVAFVSEPCRLRNRAVSVTVEASDLYGVATSDTAIVTPTWDGVCGP